MVKVQVDGISEKASEPKAKGSTISDTTDVSPLQPEKARLPMVVTLLGMVTDVNPSHFPKAHKAIEVTLLGIVTEVRLLQQ